MVPLFVDQNDGRIKMVYWPMSSLEQSTDNALKFFEGFVQIMKYNGMLRKIYDDFKGYFYQRSVFDIQSFYRMMIAIMEHWKDYNERKSRMDDQFQPPVVHKTESHEPEFSGWLESPDGNKIWMNEKQTSFGRDRAVCDHVISKSVNVSRRHAAILSVNNKFYLVDMKSTNGTFLNDEKLVPEERYELKDGDRVRIAFESFTFRMLKRNQTVSIHHI